MKTIIKRIIPHVVWESVRLRYGYIRRLILDVRQIVTLARPIESLRLFRLIRFVRPTYTMIKPPRLRVLYELSKRIDKENIPGAIVECGVYKGGSAAIMMIAQKDREKRDVWLFDSFEGLPPPGAHDGSYEREHYYKGWCEGHEDDVREVFAACSIPKTKLHMVKGWFADTLPHHTVKDIALLHVDADWYDSVKIALETFYPHVAPGGYIEFDDYGSWEGCRKAVDEFMAEHHISAPLYTRDNIGFYMQKPV